MVTVTMTIEEYEALMDLVRSANGGSTSLMTSAPGAEMPEPKPKRRKRSKYNRELSRQLKMLKKLKRIFFRLEKNQPRYM